MSQTLFRDRVQVIDLDGEHVRHIERHQAKMLCEACLAEPCWERGQVFIGAISLLISAEEFRAEIGLDRPKGRPRPSTRAPESSTGDAGRGFVHGARYRVLHMERQAAL